MKRSSYRDRDYAYGQAMLTLRTRIGLTQSGLAEYLGVSRRAVGEWESGASYPKVEHLKHFIALAVRQRALPGGREADEIRALWQLSHQKVLLDERWMAVLLRTGGETSSPAMAFPVPAASPPATPVSVDTASVTPTELPFQPTSFVGRKTELTEISRILRDPACHLLTLLGPGGIGKTRLALETAAQQRDVFADGVAFVPLASVGTPNQIVTAIGAALGLGFAGQLDPKAYLLDYLRGRRLLLVLDNFEHLVAGADLVYDILLRARQVTMLVTSRERLQLQAEWLFDVEGLACPPENAPSLADAADYSAVRLFLQRAAQVQSGFTATGEALGVVARICRQVSGMPLAIELAAASLHALPLAEIERRLGESLDVLSTTLRDVPARHRSMRAAVDQSWNLLNSRERSLFSRLAVFRGGFTGAAAVAVTSATAPELQRLVGKSLLRQSSAGDALVDEAETRCYLLEPIREYALEKLVERGEVDAVRRAHASYYLELVDTAVAQWDSPVANGAGAALDYEYDNIMDVLQWAREADPMLGLRLAGALRRFWQRRGIYSEGRLWLEEFLALAETQPDVLDTASMAVRLDAMNAAAWLASDQHDYERASFLFEQSTALRRLLGETVDETHLLAAARQARAVGDYPRAVMMLEDILSRQRALGDRRSMSSGGLGQSLYDLALMRRELGDFPRADALIREGIALHHEIGEPEGIAVGLLGLGDIARDQGDAAALREVVGQSLAITRDLGIQWAIGFALNNLALADFMDGDLTLGIARVQESVALFRNLRTDGSLAEVLVTLGNLLRAQGDHEAAYEALAAALRTALDVGPYLLVASALEGLGAVLFPLGQVALAARLLGAAALLREQMGTPVRPADQAALNSAVASVRSVLGAEAFAREWAAAGQPLNDLVRGVVSALTFNLLVAPHSVLPPAPPRVDEPGVLPPAPALQAAPAAYVDWGDAPNTPSFYGREWELAMLTQWVVDERCRVVSILGLGGIGKSTLSVSLMYRVADRFDMVIWRSLRDSPDCDALIDDFLRTAAPNSSEATTSFERRLSALLEVLRSRRVLLVLDNLETLLEEGEGAGRMRSGNEAYGRLLRRIAEAEHQSCLLITSREKPVDLLAQEGSHAPVRVLRLARLYGTACEQLLDEKGIRGSSEELARLIEMYGGNPLSLKIVAQIIVDLFGGEVAPFLEQGEVVVGGVRALLNEQFARLSALEKSLVYWLAILREPSTMDNILQMMVNPAPRARILEALESLSRRSLIDRGQARGSFTLQSVVLEYATAQIISAMTEEIVSGSLSMLVEHGIELALVAEYVRQAQRRLLVEPLLTQLRGFYPLAGSLETRLQSLLTELRKWAESAQGYAPANLAVLWQALRGDFQGLDMSRLVLRGLYLQGVEMQDASLAGALLQDCFFTETFDAILEVVSNAGLWAAANWYGEVRVWKDNGQTLYRVFRGVSTVVVPIDLSADGKLLAIADQSGGVRVWDIASNTVLWAGWHAANMYWVALSSDSRLLATCGNDLYVRLWDVATGALLDSLKHPSPVLTVAWNTDNTLLATGDEDGFIHLWRVSPGVPALLLRTMRAPTPQKAPSTLGEDDGWNKLTLQVGGLAFSPDGQTLAVASSDSPVSLWSVADGTLLQTLTGHRDRVYRVVWSSDGRTIASCSRDHTVRLWDVEQRAYRAVLQGHRGEVWSIAFSPDSRTLLSGSVDGMVRVWDVLTGQVVRVMQGYSKSLVTLDWSPDGQQLVVGGTDALVTAWNVDTGVPGQVFSANEKTISGVSWRPDDRLIAISILGDTITLWNIVTGAVVDIIREPESIFNTVAWSPDGQWLASGTYRRGMNLWNLKTGDRRRIGHLYPVQIRGVEWSPDSSRIAFAGDDGMVYVWDANSGDLIWRLEGHVGVVEALAWNPDGIHLASGSTGREYGELFVWDTHTGTLLREFPVQAGVTAALAWNLGGDQLVSGSAGVVAWWDAATGELLHQHEAHYGITQALRCSPDRKTLASCGDDGAIMLWDMESGRLLRTLRRDRPYERLNITGVRGLTDAQIANLQRLGAVDGAASPAL